MIRVIISSLILFIHFSVSLFLDLILRWPIHFSEFSSSFPNLQCCSDYIVLLCGGLTLDLAPIIALSLPYIFLVLSHLKF